MVSKGCFWNVPYIGLFKCHNYGIILQKPLCTLTIHLFKNKQIFLVRLTVQKFMIKSLKKLIYLNIKIINDSTYFNNTFKFEMF